jgi:hypothetical protein
MSRAKGSKEQNSNFPLEGTHSTNQPAFPFAAYALRNKLAKQTTMKLLKDPDATLAPLKGKTVAVLGYANQGRAQSLNLRDSGVHVIVGNRHDAYKQQAVVDGFQPLSIRRAAEAGDYLLILTSDESQPAIEIFPRPSCRAMSSAKPGPPELRAQPNRENTTSKGISGFTVRSALVGNAGMADSSSRAASRPHNRRR